MIRECAYLYTNTEIAMVVGLLPCKQNTHSFLFLLLFFPSVTNIRHQYTHTHPARRVAVGAPSRRLRDCVRSRCTDWSARSARCARQTARAARRRFNRSSRQSAVFGLASSAKCVAMTHRFRTQTADKPDAHF